MEKQYSIGEVAKITGIETHTVRFWSMELESKIKPIIGKGSRRYYTESDIKTFLEVKDLIHSKGYTISMLKKGFPFEQQHAHLPENFAELVGILQQKVSYLLSLHE